MSLQDFRAMMERCSNCLGCKWIPFDKVQSQRFGENCPTNLFYNFHLYSVRGKWQAGQAYLDGEYDFASSPMLLESVQSCMACGSCDISCKVCRFNLDCLDYNVELKKEAVSKGFILPSQTEMLESLKTESTLIPGAKRAARKDWAAGIPFVENAETVFFPGCKYAYDPALQGFARKAAETLLDAGVALGYLGEADRCCGGRGYQQGFAEAFGDCADVNIKLFESRGVRTIVTPCADCCHALRRLYAARGMQIRVLHLVEYLDELISAGTLHFTRSVPMTVTYHDPCHLGRLGEPYVEWNGTEKMIMNSVHTWDPPRPRYNGAHGVYDAPRNILRAIPGVTLVEMERTREYALCCGAGANCQINFPNLSQATAGERVTEANATGADALVTACPWCEANFRDTVDENGRKIAVLDLMDLVSRAL